MTSESQIDDLSDKVSRLAATFDERQSRLENSLNEIKKCQQSNSDTAENLLLAEAGDGKIFFDHLFSYSCMNRKKLEKF